MKKILKKGIAVAVASALLVTSVYSGILVSDKAEAAKDKNTAEELIREYSDKYNGEISYGTQLYVWSGDNAFNPKDYLPDGCLFEGETIEYCEGQIDLTPGATSHIIYKITYKNGEHERVRYQIYPYTAVPRRVSSTVRSDKQDSIIYGLTQEKGYGGYLPNDYTETDKTYEAENELTILKGSSYYPQHAFMDYNSDEYILSMVDGELNADAVGTYTLTYSISPISDGAMNWYEKYKINVVDEAPENKGMKVVATDNIIHATVTDNNGYDSEVYMGKEYNLNAGVRKITVQNKRGFDAYANVEILKNGKTVNNDDIIKSIDKKDGVYVITFKNKYDYEGYEIRLSNQRVLSELLARPKNCVNGGWDDYADKGIIVDEKKNSPAKTFASEIFDGIKGIFSTDAEAAETTEASLSLAGCVSSVTPNHYSQEKGTGNKVIDGVDVIFKKGKGGVKAKIADMLSDKGYQFVNSSDFPGKVSLYCGGDGKAAYYTVDTSHITLNAYLIKNGKDAFVRIKGTYHANGDSYQYLTGEVPIPVEKGNCSVQVEKVTKVPEGNQSDTEGAVAGAKFGIYNTKSDAEKDKNHLFYITTDASGMAYASKSQSQKLTADKSYWVREVSAPEGTYLNKTAYKVTMKADKIKKVTIENFPAKIQMNITKVDSKNKNKKLSGAVFTIYEWDIYDKEYYPISAVTTNSSGSAATGLLYYTQSNGGMFKIKETKAPNGYDLDPKAEKTISIGNIKQDKTLTWEVSNEEEVHKPGYIEIQKKIEHPDEIDLTATFTIYLDEACTNAVGTITTNASGYGKSDLLPEVRDYWVKETYWSCGMEPADLSAKTKVPKEKTIDLQTYRIEPELSSKTLGRQEHWYAGLSVKKIDEVTGDPLNGAEFTFYEWDGAKYVPIAIRKSQKVGNENGIAQIDISEKLVRYKKTNQGMFAVKETKAPEGYRIKDTSMHYATLNLFNKNTVLTFDDYIYANQPLGYLDINKIIIDSADKKITSEDMSSDALGITYGLYFDEKCTNQVPGYGSMVLGSDGHFKTDGLIPGTYWLRENTLNETIFSNNPKAKISVEIQAGKTTYLDGEYGLWRDGDGILEDGSRDWDDTIWNN